MCGRGRNKHTFSYVTMAWSFKPAMCGIYTSWLAVGALPRNLRPGIWSERLALKCPLPHAIVMLVMFLPAAGCGLHLGGTTWAF